MEKLERMNFLINEIKKHNISYYDNDNPTISDAEYDALYYELVDLEKELNIVLKNSPTSKVGSSVSKGFKKRTHKQKMYSLNKVRSRDELEKWMEDMREFSPNSAFSLEYKFDGLQLVVEYKNGKYFSATTRGNGEIGEDVTSQVATIKSLPKIISFKQNLTVQGEGMMTNSNFEKYNKTASEPLKNPRNAVAGAIRNLDINQTKKRNLDFFCYSVLQCEDKTFASQKEMNDFLVENGFLTGGYFHLLNSIDQIESEIKKVDKIKNKLDFQIDGMVIKLDSVKERNQVGFTNKFPKWALAFKFEAEELTTTLKDVIWQVGRTGKVTPLAIVEPVFLAGATVQRATLNNIEDIERKKLSINSRVFIRRSNEVIPEILGLSEKSDNSIEIKEPKKCPCCNHELTKKGPLLFCENYFGCRDQIIARLCHFCSRDAMNIEGLNEKTITDFCDNLGISSFSQLYSITKEQLMMLELIKEKKANNILQSIKNSKTPTFAKFLYSLGISEIGIKTARDLQKHFESLEQLKNATKEELVNIRDVGEIMAGNLVEFFNSDYFCDEIERLLNCGVVIQYPEKNTKENFFTGKKFVITGTLENFSRKELEEILTQNGADVASSVSTKTDFVIVGENAGSKLEKAQKLNIKILTENEFLNIFEKNN